MSIENFERLAGQLEAALRDLAAVTKERDEARRSLEIRNVSWDRLLIQNSKRGKALQTFIQLCGQHGVTRNSMRKEWADALAAAEAAILE